MPNFDPNAAYYKAAIRGHMLQLENFVTTGKIPKKSPLSETPSIWFELTTDLLESEIDTFRKRNYQTAYTGADTDFDIEAVEARFNDLQDLVNEKKVAHQHKKLKLF